MIPGPGRRRWIIIGLLGVLLIAGVIFMTIEQRTRISWPEVIFRELMAPLQSGVYHITKAVTGLAGNVVRLFYLYSENDRLKAENEALLAELSAAREALRENEELRTFLQLAKDKQKEIVVAEVIARSPVSWFNTIVLNKGATSGIRQDMAVITPEGVVGRIFSVTAHTSQAHLITDPKSAVGGRVQRTGEIVLVEGIGSPDDARVRVKLLDREVDLQPGDKIVTSGLSDIYPKGLLIGEVVEVHEVQHGLNRYGILVPAADIAHLEWVAVITK